MIKDVIADVYAAKGEGARGILEGLKSEARDALDLALAEAPEDSKNQNRYRWAREHVLPLLLRIEDPEERYATLDDVADARSLKVSNLQKALSKMEGDLDEPEDEGTSEEVSMAQADRLIRYAQEVIHALFTDQHGAPHTLVNGEAMPLNSRRCYLWLRGLMWDHEQRSCRSEALTTAASTLAVQAEFSDDIRELHTRGAWHEETLYYELSPGNVVKVNSSGWTVTTESPVLFRRIGNLKDLPTPMAGGSLKPLEDLVNLRTERDKRLFKAYAVTVVLPHIPRPILLATGVKGSGKSTASLIIKRLIDPSTPESVRLDKEFLQKASHSYAILLDNQSRLPSWGGDQLCRLVTGEADSKRKLFTDDEDVIYELKRVILLNGINVPTDQGDVLDRSLPIELERIPEDEVKGEVKLWEEFEAAQPQLLGAIFDVLSQALTVLPSLELATRPRLATWGEYMAAVYEAMGWGKELFAEDWKHVVKAQNQATFDGSPVAQAIIKFMEDTDEYEASSANLHKKLAVVAEDLGVDRDKEWPKSARWLWRRIKEVLTLLTAAGIEASRKEASNGTIITLRKTSKDDATDATDASGPMEDPEEGDDAQEDDVPLGNDPEDENDEDDDDEGLDDEDEDEEEGEEDDEPSNFWDDFGPYADGAPL
jgi:hypothetical protein